MSTTNNVKVLYMDYAGHPAPLSHCFHATASRCLSSAGAQRNPPTCRIIVDSAYCPQCFLIEDKATAATLGFCESCKQCPLCMAIASVTVDDGGAAAVAYYKCGYCDWNSKDCGVTTSISSSSDGGSIGKEEMMQASNDLAAMVKEKQDESLVESQYQDLLRAFEDQVKKQNKPQATKMKRGIQQKQHQAWTVESLEESLVTKQQVKTRNYIGNKQIVLDNVPRTLDTNLQDVSTTLLLLQPPTTPFLISSKSDLLPLPLPLRAKCSVKCRAELQQGRPGILLKPKLNPLEGDTSLRSGHGQWWKKDSSAVNVIPKISVVKQHSTNTNRFLLNVSNPTMSMVRLQLMPSDYTGETNNNNNNNMGIMKKVLMDSLDVFYKDIVVLDSTTRIQQSTKLVELESVKDTFLEMGRNTQVLPDAVVQWGKDGTTTSSSGEMDASFIRLVATQKDVAWFELNVVERGESNTTRIDTAASGDDNNVWVAVPIALQIQVGEGSWESSLIKKKKEDVEGPDLVTFDILIAWEQNSTSTSETSEE